MSEPIGGPPAADRVHKSRCWFVLAVAFALGSGTNTKAGAIHQKALSASELLRIEKTNPWSDYWVRALRQHKLHLIGPTIHRVLKLDADGTLPLSPFVRYMQWREELRPKQFATFHAELAGMLRKVKTPATPTTPGTVVPPSTGVPIEPPDFTPIVPEFVKPPETPEPTALAISCSALAAVALGRRLRKKP